jgi:hypothetical protein
MQTPHSTANAGPPTSFDDRPTTMVTDRTDRTDHDGTVTRIRDPSRGALGGPGETP